MAARELDLRQSRGAESAELFDSADIGTCFANSSYDPGYDLRRRNTRQSTTHGGARNHAGRESVHLSKDQANKLWDASKFAIASGFIFQRHWTINYEQLGVTPEAGAAFVQHLMDMLGKQARRDGGRLTAIWVRERGQTIGEHAHILMHLPSATKLRGRTKRWIELAAGNHAPGVGKIKHVGGSLMVAPDVQAENAQNVVRYMLKGVEPEYGRLLGLTRLEDAGSVVGKRCGTTQNIGPTARRRAGFEHPTRPSIAIDQPKRF